MDVIWSPEWFLEGMTQFLLIIQGVFGVQCILYQSSPCQKGFIGWLLIRRSPLHIQLCGMHRPLLHSSWFEEHFPMV